MWISIEIVLKLSKNKFQGNTDKKKVKIQKKYVKIKSNNKNMTPSM